MKNFGRQPRLREMLEDPLVRMVMARDGVRRSEIEKLYEDLAKRTPPRRKARMRKPWEPAPRPETAVDPESGRDIHIRMGCEFGFEHGDRVPMVLLVNVHSSLVASLTRPDSIRTDPPVELVDFRDSFGNRSARLVAPSPGIRIWTDFVIRAERSPDPPDESATQDAIEELSGDVLCYLLPSRYCEVDRIGDVAAELFGGTPPGWERVKAINDWVHSQVEFAYHHARPTRTALEVYQERVGVCRDFQHLAIAFCRAMGVPARYVGGYLGDIGVPKDPAPMDFSAWYEVWLSGRWHTFDARHNTPRIGRTPTAIGRDAADTSMVTSFGPTRLTSFRVWSDEIEARTRFSE